MGQSYVEMEYLVRHNGCVCQIRYHQIVVMCSVVGDQLEWLNMVNTLWFAGSKVAIALKAHQIHSKV